MNPSLAQQRRILARIPEFNLTPSLRTRTHETQLYLDEWVKAVNNHGGFGKWKAGLCLNPADLPTVIHKSASEPFR